jgi:hypothetical protein
LVEGFEFGLGDDFIVVVGGRVGEEWRGWGGIGVEGAVGGEGEQAEGDACEVADGWHGWGRGKGRLGINLGTGV